MAGYTKLFSSILHSSIWCERNETRIVWITMLAMSNKDGEIQAAVPGLARMAGVSVEECQAALDCLLSPDIHSRTKDKEGRRIEEIDGGWRLVNHAKYRAKMNEEERREYNKIKQRERREKLRPTCQRKVDASMTVNDNQQCQHIADSRVHLEKEKTRANAFPSREQVLSYSKSAPMPISDESAIAFFDHQEAQGWRMANGNPITNWQAALRRWASIGNEREKSKPVAKRRSTDPMPGEVCELI